MFKNRITVCMYTQNPEMNPTFQKLELLFKGFYSERTLDWAIRRTDNKILQYSEVSAIDWPGTLTLWETFASHFPWYNIEVKNEWEAKEIVIDMNNEDSSICIIINFNI